MVAAELELLLLLVEYCGNVKNSENGLFDPPTSSDFTSSSFLAPSK
jgi:hypothetical protein